MRRRSFDLIVAIGIAILNIVLALLPTPVKFIQLLGALPLVFILPGYLLMEALFQKRLLEMMNLPSFIIRPGSMRPLNTLERFALSIGLSITIDIVGGFLLNLLPIGLTTISWLSFFGILTIVLVIVIAVQRLRGRDQNIQASAVPLSRLRLSFWQVLLFGLAGVIVAFSIVFSIGSASRQPYPGFTQLWLLPPTQSESSCAVQLGVRNFEGTDVTYRVTMQVNGVSKETWVPIALAPQQEWNRSVPITFELTPQLVKKALVEVQLYKLDNPTVVYRHVHVLLHTVSQEQNGKTPLCATSQ